MRILSAEISAEAPPTSGSYSSVLLPVCTALRREAYIYVPLPRRPEPAYTGCAVITPRPWPCGACAEYHLYTELLQGPLDLFRVKPKWTGPGFARHTSIPVDHVQSVGPSRIGFFRGIREIVDQRGNPDMQISHARTSQRAAFADILRHREYNPLLNIRLHLPYIAGMSFENVDDIERHAIPVLVIQLVERGNLPAKRRSGVAAENQHHRFAAAE